MHQQEIDAYFANNVKLIPTQKLIFRASVEMKHYKLINVYHYQCSAFQMKFQVVNAAIYHVLVLMMLMS